MVRKPPHFNELSFPYLSFFILAMAFVILLFSFTPYIQKSVFINIAIPTPNHSLYVCPNSPWVDCMPSPDSPPKPQCHSDYLQWARQNCPDFQGAAL
ncbi:hypothetical protein A2410_00625 [Candidatus Shapirobacteria bacterium RIFOXYC1_FULL_38_24]|uniref:Uncharacterized protein n=3 Tax=Candidatus Shapironibacteriota TaxID=1752721 RepID=A0A0G0JMX1_9BACT|nr:MAG: hypothetical protein US90_C0027G0002 [Candidatus Shapirobacteria bacterium GW2011_GWE2_38_30]KKQ89914.1 MAG: hypothetical protein UT14_C0049G0002 [Candidatus Shapirobacteria bacterium GW2011_GWE1_38_92]OGL56962.1 MAG: hypothetical protein A2367_03660 [Candidatus Shapirobacteria bacterium RIFOXYB1_FULL_38_38]OGL57484.1 MAG: hypothetical protein A2410_00625 [Candidatus Shapirobacteria bacterium RIFOXYC1_FULL_38_24]HAP38098.1 hypothetical protein [Candidatus Shapirobacteria bacterium]